MTRRVHSEGIREREEMRRASEDVETPPWELAAIDEDGNELYRTEYFETKEEAQADCDAFDEGEASWTENIPDEVDHFEPRKVADE